MAKKVAAAPAKRSESFRTPPPATYATAMDKLRDELAKSRDNYVRVVGEYLTEFLLAHPEAEGKIMDADKSIAGSLATVRKEAEKVKTGNMAVLDDKTVFGIVLGYFGIKGTDNREQGTGMVEDVPAEATGEATSSDPPQAAAHLPRSEASPLGLKGKAFGETGKDDTADPFDLDALLGVM